MFHGQQAHGTSGAKAPMPIGLSYHPFDDILAPPANDLIDDIGEESDDHDVRGRLNWRSFKTTKTGFKK